MRLVDIVLILRIHLELKILRLDRRIKELGEAKYQQYRIWFQQRLDNAIKAAESRRVDVENDNSSQSESSFGVNPEEPCPDHFYILNIFSL